MEQYFNENAWITYPIEKGQDVIMSISFSASNKYDKIIQTLIQKYGGTMSNCKIGNHTRLIVIKNISIMEILFSMYAKNTNSTSEMYKEYIYLYQNQHVYFDSMYMI
jgi:hypothetical protein